MSVNSSYNRQRSGCSLLAVPVSAEAKVNTSFTCGAGDWAVLKEIAFIGVGGAADDVTALGRGLTAALTAFLGGEGATEDTAAGDGGLGAALLGVLGSGGATEVVAAGGGALGAAW